MPHRLRLSFGSPKLDRFVGGGLLQGSTTLVSGAPGVGKTTFSLQFLMAGVRQSQPGLLVSFEEYPASLIHDARQLGWDLEQLQRQGLLRILFTSPEVFYASLKSQTGPFVDIMRQLKPQRLVVDSAAHFQRLTADPAELREIYNTVANAIKREQLTAVLIDEANRITDQQQSPISPLLFVVDGIILMRYVEVESTMERAIAVVKMRGTDHQKEIRRFEIAQGGLKIGEPFAGRAGVLFG